MDDNPSLNMSQTIKCVFVGDGAVGKSCLLISYCLKKFPEEYVPTIFDNYSVSLRIGEQNVNFLLFDTAGQEDYDQIRPLSYPQTNVFVICFSLCSYSSFQNITEKWIPEIQVYSPNTPFIIVGTMSDLRDFPQTKEQIEEQIFQMGGSKYIECSALVGLNVQMVFKEAIMCTFNNSFNDEENIPKQKTQKDSSRNLSPQTPSKNPPPVPPRSYSTQKKTFNKEEGNYSIKRKSFNKEEASYSVSVPSRKKGIWKLFNCF